MKYIQFLIDYLILKKKIADSLNIEFSDFMKLGHYRYLRAILKDRWLILKKNNTYPNMIKPLIIK